jgi:putative membrane protein
MCNDYERSESVAGMIKGTVAGMIGGLAGAWAMNRFQAGVKSLSACCAPTENSDSQSESGQGAPHPKSESSRSQDAATTVKLAEAISRTVFDHPLSRSEKKVAAPMVHYGYGAMAGGVYGAVAEAAPIVTECAGAGYGTVLWLLGDEVAVPMLGLSKSPQKYPVSTHLSAAASHVVYGLALEFTRRMVLKAL